jgi:hypothetical protein
MRLKKLAWTVQLPSVGTIIPKDLFGTVCQGLSPLSVRTHAGSRDRIVAAGKMLTAILSHAPDKNGLERTE